MPRKKATSVTLGEQGWRWQGAVAAAAQHKESVSQRLAQICLPQPATHSQRARLTGQVMADLFAITLGFAITAWITGAFAPPSMVLLYGVVFTLFGYSERLYHPEVVQDPRQQRAILAKTTLWSASLIGFAFLSSHSTPVAVSPAALGITFGFVAMLAWRSRWHESSTRGRAGVDKNVLILGAGHFGRELASRLEHDRLHRCVVRGFLDENQPIGDEVRGRVSDLARIARSEFVDEIVITSPRDGDVRRAIGEARRNHIDIKMVPELFGLDPTQVALERFGDLPVLTLSEERVPSFGLSLKRALDVVFSAMTIVLLAPLLAVIALVIKLESPGPVLYVAPRLGRKGCRFPCYKFRTMVRDADRVKEKLREHNERSGPFFKMANDPRTTRVGKILRRYSLDELPQLWNVLRGEMSLVGPRPHPVDDFQRYSLDDLQRLDVTPGLTGLWQVTARGDPSFERNMALDREYIGSWSLGLDFRILCRTLGAVLRGGGV